ncbi:hypothetical protein N0V93_006073 [Gnomoniopsis smithogilvyi]|uniref:Uncharacterized protein n=1 Tax=Gnomoniopsis smithogilvyi TaxID=1191159 RepID=A0A9W8YP58_9PEZI|nr:hypothetical protein N0V93_006073 [Gnomoniopsis smithogilvyi]
MSSYAKGANPLWGAGSSAFSTTSAPQHQQHRRQTWASVTWATGQSIISGMLSPNKKDFDVGQHNRNEYHTFRDEILMGPPAYDSIVSPRTRPGSSSRRALPARMNSLSQSQSQQPQSQLVKAPPAQPASLPRHQALNLPPLPRLLGLENLDEWDDMLHRTLRLHGLIEYINPGVPEPNASSSLTHEEWASNCAAVCLLIVGSLSSDVRDTLTAFGYEASDLSPAALHALVREALPKAAGEDVSSWMRELSTISPGERRFEGSLREYCLRVAYLRRRLYQAEPQPNDNLVLVMAVLGLARCERYEGYSFTLGRELERGALSWGRLMSDLAGIHGREVRERRERCKARGMEEE